MDYANGEMYQRFCDSMREAVAVRFGEDAEIEIHKVMKNNSLELDSLSILLPAQTVTPNFYLQEYYKRYEK